MFGLSPLELLVCLFIVVLLFGVKKLPELGSGLGQGISNFRRAFKDSQAIDVTPPKSPEKDQEQLQQENENSSTTSSKEHQTTKVNSHTV